MKTSLVKTTFPLIKKVFLYTPCKHLQAKLAVNRKIGLMLFFDDLLIKIIIDLILK